MGTDIHMSVQLRAVTGYTRNDAQVQKLKRELATDPTQWEALEALEVRDGPWEVAALSSYGKVLPLKPAGTWGLHFTPWNFGPKEEDVEQRYGDTTAFNLTGPLPAPWWEGRDYETFARLADVRNGRGFGGVHTGEPVVPISAPRGLPNDWVAPVVPTDPDYEEEEGLPAWWPGDHSFSHLLASEVLAYDGWTAPHRAGTVSYEDWQEWTKAGRKGDPRSWCGSVSGGRTSTRSEGDVAMALAAGAAPFGHGISGYVRCTWRSDGRDWPVLDMAKAWADRFGGDGVRFVFGFDS